MLTNLFQLSSYAYVRVLVPSQLAPSTYETWIKNKRKRKIRSASQDGCLIHSFKRWYNLINPSLWVLKRTTATDIPEIVDFEDHWDKLETKLYDWMKSSLPNIVANLIQSHISKIHQKIVDGYISSAEFQRSLAERLLLIIFIYYYYFL